MTRARLVRAVLAGALLVPLLLWVSGCWLFNVTPIAAFTISSQAGQAPFAVNFSGALSEDEDGYILHWEWNFGDGSESVSGENVTHTYTTAGTFTAVLWVTDNDGGTATNSKAIYVSPAEPAGPIATFTASPTSGTSPLSVYVDASASAYAAGVISQYTWNWGDGATGYGKTASHTYFSASAKTYTVTLTVTGTDSKTSTATKSISLSIAGGGTTPVSGAPSARFSIIANTTTDGGPAGTTGVAPYRALFDPKDTEVDVGKTLLQLIWSFGDGSSTSTPNMTAQWHTYLTANPSETFSVTLLAMDNEAATDSITKTVKSYNHTPVAGFEICNPAGGHTTGDDDEHYANETDAINADRWDDDRSRTNNVKNDGVIIGDLQNVGTGPPYTINVFIRSQLSTAMKATGGWLDLDAGVFSATLPDNQRELEMAEGVLAAPGSTKPEPDDFAATNNAFSYDPEGQAWQARGAAGTLDDYPDWFPAGNQAWGIEWIHVDWDDGGEETFSYRVETDSTDWTTGGATQPLYDQDAVMMHTYTVDEAGLNDVKTITIRVVDFLGAEATYSRTLRFQKGSEAVDDLAP